MSRDRGYVREIDWLDVFPWLGLARTVVVAWGPTKLLLALLGIALTTAGWLGISRLYERYWTNEQVERQAAAYRQAEAWHDAPPVDVTQMAKDDAAANVTATARSLGGTLIEIPAWYTRPFWQMFRQDTNWAAFSMALLCALWTLAVWAFCGGAITRLAAVRLTQDRRISVAQACRHAIGKWLSYFSGPLFPIGAALLFAVFAGIIGLLARPYWGFVVVGALWPLGMIFALLCAVLLVAALVGWPLMWSAVSTESSDAFDSFNRSFSYVTQRPFHFLWYLIVAAFIGAVSWLVVAVIGELTIYLTAWGVTWGSGPERAAEIFAAADTLTHRPIVGPPVEIIEPLVEATGSSATSPANPSVGAETVAFWSNVVRWLVLAYGHSYLWTAATGIYLLLRRDTDATPLDEVYLDSAEDPYGLPPIRRDGAGVTVLDEGQNPGPGPAPAASGPS